MNARNYSTLMGAGEKDRASIRTGTKMPVQTGSPQMPQFQYIDVGVNIDCSSLRRLQNRLAIYVSAELSTALPPQDKGTPLGPQIRLNRWNSPVVVTIGKPTMLFSSDDLASTRTLQLELTATPVKYAPDAAYSGYTVARNSGTPRAGSGSGSGSQVAIGQRCAMPWRSIRSEPTKSAEPDQAAPGSGAPAYAAVVGEIRVFYDVTAGA